MSIKKVIIEIIKSGLIPLIVGSFILLTTRIFTNNMIAWSAAGLLFILEGLCLGLRYTEEPSIFTHETRPQEEEG